MNSVFKNDDFCIENDGFWSRLGGLRLQVEQRMASAGVAALLTPTVPHVPHPISDYENAESDPQSVGAAVGRNCLPGNVWGMCGVSMPVQRFSEKAGLPVGLQLLCPAGQDATALELALGIEALE